MAAILIRRLPSSIIDSQVNPFVLGQILDVSEYYANNESKTTDENLDHEYLLDNLP